MNLFDQSFQPRFNIGYTALVTPVALCWKIDDVARVCNLVRVNAASRRA